MAVTDWFRIVQMAQAWFLRGRPKALAETRGKEHSLSQMRDHLLVTVRGEAVRRKANPEESGPSDGEQEVSKGTA